MDPALHDLIAFTGLVAFGAFLAWVITNNPKGRP